MLYLTAALPRELNGNPGTRMNPDDVDLAKSHRVDHCSMCLGVSGYRQGLWRRIRLAITGRIRCNQIPLARQSAHENIERAPR
jgi:hypothetical protein